MSNELTNYNPLAITDNEQKNLEKFERENLKFVPSISITHPMSQACKTGQCKAGEWWDGGQQASLGLEIEIVLIDYFWKFQAYNKKNNSFLESLKKNRTYSPSDKDYQEFFVKYKNDTIQQGMNQLWYLPRLNIYRSFYGKGQKSGGCSQIRSLSVASYGTILQLPRPILVETASRSWYEFKVVQLSEKIPISSNDEVTIFFKNLFFKQTQDEIEEVQSGQR